MGPTGFPEISERKWHSRLCKIP